jgi:hypothetical protein
VTGFFYASLNSELKTMKVKTIDQAISRYGAITSGDWKNQSEWMILLSMPNWVHKQVINAFTHKSFTGVYINKDAAQPLLDALENVRLGEYEEELKTFNGCFNIRDVRGFPGRPSAHSYGLAVDFNALENRLGNTPRFSKGFANCFIKSGFSWGGNFSRKDGMHFSYCWE